jgi:RNA polymerase sigma-70 factor (ECF subfamily)
MSLAAAYLASFGAAEDPSATLERALEETCVSARRAWPDVEVDLETYVAYLGARAAHDAPPREALAALHADDLYLACACVAGQPAAVTVFESRYLQPARRYVARTDPDLADEVYQLIATDLLVGTGGIPGLARYSGRAAVGTFVRLAAIRKAMYLRRGRKETPVADLQPGVTNDVEVELLKRMYAPEFHSALAAAIASLDQNVRTALKLHFIDGMTLDAIGVIYRVNKSTVSRWIGAARHDLFVHARRLFAERLKMPAAEADSLIELLQSRIDVTLRWFL